MSHVIAKIEGKKKGPDMEEGSLMKYSKHIKKPDLSKAIPRKVLKVPVSKMAALHLRSKVEWFSGQKDKLSRDILLEMIICACLLCLRI